MEIAYILGLLSLGLGTAWMEAADFGMSMVVAPAYVLYLKLSPIFPFVTFGMAEYMFQAILLLVMAAVLRGFRAYYLLSFGTAVLYGCILDGCMALAALIPMEGMILRLLSYGIGMLFCSMGVALLFHTYIPPEVYELFVKEVSAKYHFSIAVTKTVYDCISCAIAVGMSFLFFGFGHFEGVKWGTVLCACVNGLIIKACSKWLDARFTFRNMLFRR